MWPRFGPFLLYFIYLLSRCPAAFLWFACGPNLANRSGPPKCHHSTKYAGRGKVLDLGWICDRIKISVAQIGPVMFYFIYLFSWLIFGLPMACLWPKSGKPEWSTQMPSFYTVCGPGQGVGPLAGFGPELK